MRCWPLVWLVTFDISSFSEPVFPHLCNDLFGESEGNIVTFWQGWRKYMLLMYIRPSIVIQMYTSVCVCVSSFKIHYFIASLVSFLFPPLSPFFRNRLFWSKFQTLYIIHKYNPLTDKDSKKDNYSTTVTLQDT